MKYFDAFSGYGGFSLGIQQAYEKPYCVCGKDANMDNSDTEYVCLTCCKPNYSTWLVNKINKKNNEQDSWMVGNRQTDNSIPGRQETLDSSGVGNLEAERPGNGSIESKATCIGFSEIDKYAIQVYQKHFPTHKPYGDITKLDPTTLQDFDLLVGGFPCQAFSYEKTNIRKF